MLLFAGCHGVHCVPAYGCEGGAMNDFSISDYGIIGNCETAALINAQGGIDWMCLPAFDGPSFFGALLDRDRGGEFILRPTAFDRVEQRYLGDSAVLETVYHCGERHVVLTDFFVIARKKAARFYDFSSLAPTRKLVRMVKLGEGQKAVEMEMRLAARPNYARTSPDWRDQSAAGSSPLRNLSAFRCQDAFFFATIPVESRQDDLISRFELHPGETKFAVLDYSNAPTLPSREAVAEWFRITRAFWEEWNLFNYYRGRHERMIRRSAVTLKLLTYAPTGAFVAAATTSLPEWPGAGLNWDYRYSWVRDTALFINTFFQIGYSGEAKAFFEFIAKKYAEGKLHQDDGKIEVLFPIRDENASGEVFLDHLSGYRNSRPVRIGNRAADQYQLDNFGHLLQSLYYWQQTGGKLNKPKRMMLEELVAGVLAHWRQPDNGIWELPEDRAYTFGRVMAWVGLRRACAMGIGDRDHVLRTRDELQREVMEKSFRRKAEPPYLAASFQSNQVDASDLMAFTTGFLSREDGIATREAIEARLGRGPFLRRSEFIEQEEGAFLICTFWLINHLIMEDKLDRAEELLEQMIARANPLGLYSEEIDPETGDFLGNFPQAFTHLALIESILNLEHAKRDPNFAALPDHEKFRKSIGATIGWRGVLAGFWRVPGTFRLLFSQRSKWRG